MARADLIIRRDGVKDPLNKILALLSLDIPQIKEPPTALVAELKVRNVGNGNVLETCQQWYCHCNGVIDTGNIGKQGNSLWDRGSSKRSGQHNLSG